MGLRTGSVPKEGAMLDMLVLRLLARVQVLLGGQVVVQVWVWVSAWAVSTAAPVTVVGVQMMQRA